MILSVLLFVEPAEQRRVALRPRAGFAAQGLRRAGRARQPRGRRERLPEGALPGGRGELPACDVRLEGVVNLCALRERPLVLTFFFDRGADCEPQVDRTERVRTASRRSSSRPSTSAARTATRSGGSWRQGAGRSPWRSTPTARSSTCTASAAAPPRSSRARAGAWPTSRSATSPRTSCVPKAERIAPVTTELDLELRDGWVEEPRRGVPRAPARARCARRAPGRPHELEGAPARACRPLHRARR